MPDAKETKEKGTLRIVDAAVARGGKGEKQKNIELIYPRNRKMPSAQDGQKPAVHRPTVRRRPVRSGLHVSAAARKPYLQQGNKAKRLNCAWKHWNRGAEKQQPVLWTDESQFETLGSNKERLQASVERAGGSFMTSVDGATYMPSSFKNKRGGHALN